MTELATLAATSESDPMTGFCCWLVVVAALGALLLYALTAGGR